MKRASIALALWLLPSLALAHPGVERARALVDEGSYEEADAEMTRLLAGNELSRDDLITLYEAHALLDHGRADEASLERTLLALASVSPSHRFGPRFPPDLAARFVEVGRHMGGALRLAVDRVPTPAGITVEPRVMHDAASIVRQVRVRVFDPASGEWRDAEPPVTAAPGRELLLFVEAIGPGGAVLSREGSGENPLRVAGAAVATEAVAPGPQPAADDGGGFPDWGVVLIVIGAILLVGGGIAAGAVYASQNPVVEWDLSSPTMR